MPESHRQSPSPRETEAQQVVTEVLGNDYAADAHTLQTEVYVGRRPWQRIARIIDSINETDPGLSSEHILFRMVRTDILDNFARENLWPPA